MNERPGDGEVVPSHAVPVDSAAVAASSLAVTLVDVTSGHIVVASAPAARLLGAAVDDMVGSPLLRYSGEPEATANALRMLTSGIVESYQTPRVIRRHDGTTFRGRVWVRLAVHDGRRAFLLVFTDDSARGTFGESLGFVAPPPEFPSVPGLETLSARETEVLERLVAGARVPQIAEQMFLAPPTIRNHLSAMYRKLGVHSQAELVALLRPGPSDGGALTR